VRRRRDGLERKYDELRECGNWTVLRLSGKSATVWTDVVGLKIANDSPRKIGMTH